MRFRSPILFHGGTLHTNYHGDDNTALCRQWSVVGMPRGIRIYRYFSLGDAVFLDIQFRWKPWKVITF